MGSLWSAEVIRTRLAGYQTAVLVYKEGLLWILFLCLLKKYRHRDKEQHFSHASQLGDISGVSL